MAVNGALGGSGAIDAAFLEGDRDGDGCGRSGWYEYGVARLLRGRVFSGSFG
jgi:hypothetical protein